MNPSPEASETALPPAVEAVIEVAPFAMLVADETGSVTAANGSWTELSGLDTASSMAGGWLRVLHEPDRQPILETVRRAAGDGRLSLDLEIHTPGGLRWTRWWVTPHVSGTPHLVFLAVHDVHAERMEQEDLRHWATHDPLTGLANRRSFLDSVEQAMLRAERGPERVCVLYLDLDGFKAVNDRGGHALGDRVLGAVAGRLRQVVRAADTVARMGGDEFAVLLERVADEAEADAVVARIESVLSGDIEMGGQLWPIAASIGKAISRGPLEGVNELLGRADLDMYEAKRRHHDGGSQPPAEPARPSPREQLTEIQSSMTAIRGVLEGLLGEGDS